MPLSDFKLLTKADAAAVFGVCTKTIDNYIREGLLPPPVPFASRDYWHPEDFRAFLDATFRRSQPATTGKAQNLEVPPATTDGPTLADATHRVNNRGERDSNPAVRQRIRQQERLRALNAAA